MDEPMMDERYERVWGRICRLRYYHTQEAKDLEVQLRGFLGNECVKITLEERLDYIEERLDAFYASQGTMSITPKRRD